ncbi:UDP-N-acetylmuramate--L-alanine ligase [Anaerofustis butyriciformans]|uniref:UDP-N-acetylmuramate--L-alanine ligase n=1 Tax=Anaerofustis butyriciformans TaxID=3108533 RepID=UPI002E2EB82A|nr:UDP-N-acetylmuramate--L-alanine ligase [Anaerofustis sp. HA2171]
MNIDLENIKKIYFIGIGGTSMSGLALMSKINGKEVLGSDMRLCVYTEKLEKNGIKVIIGHNKENITDDIDLIVYSAAIRENNPERVEGKNKGILEIERSIFLGLISKYYKKTVAVSGTHGKTTTSSLMSLVFLNANLDPSISIGGTLRKINGNSRVGDSDYFVIEACEFVDSFLHSRHFVGTIQNIERDHLDYFTGGIEQIKESFKKFAKITPKDGLLVVNGDDKNVLDILDGLECKIVKVGLSENNDFVAKNITYNELGKPRFDVYKNGEFYYHFELNIPGEHNVLNALSVVAVSDFFMIDKKIVNDSFKEFMGAKRRFEKRGVVNNITVIEDYAHHPTELKVTIDACKNYEHKKLFVIFQPHTYSRTFLLFDEFVDAMKGADELILNDIYSDREDNEWNIYSEDIAEKVVEKYGIPSRVISEFSDIRDYIVENAKPGDFVLVAGSQSINQVAYDIVDKLKEIYE